MQATSSVRLSQSQKLQDFPSLQLLPLLFCSSSIVHLLPSVGGRSGLGKCERVMEVSAGNVSDSSSDCQSMSSVSKRDWELEHNNRLIDAARHILILQTIRIAWFPLETREKMPSNILRDCSRKYALLIKGELLSGHSFEIPAVVSGGDYWFSLLFNAFYLWVAPKLGSYDGWRPCNEMQCTCVSLAALSRNSLADSRSFKFFNSISNAWFNHFPDGLVHCGFEMISVQADVWAESNLSNIFGKKWHEIVAMAADTASIC